MKAQELVYVCTILVTLASAIGAIARDAIADKAQCEPGTLGCGTAQVADAKE